MLIAHNQVQSKMAQEILHVQEEPVSLKHARTSTSNYTKRNGGNITKKFKKLKETLERFIIVRSETLKGVRGSGECVENFVWGELLVPEDEYRILPFQMKL
jgi:hypothetical protein